MTIRILQGDCREMLRTLPDASVHCCVTSPPYWGLRDYGTVGQLGMEKTYQEHIAVLVDVFREVRRVLRSDGTLWLNYGDCYATSPNGRSAADTKAVGNDDRTFRDKPFSTIGGALKPKDLAMLPARLAIALQEDGWWIRSDIIWSKPNPMPESIRDRPSSSHEHVFLLTKSARYFYDGEAVREPASESTLTRWAQDVDNQIGSARANGDTKTYGMMKAVGRRRPNGVPTDGFVPGGNTCGVPNGGRNCRNVWTIATQPFSDAHFATFPPELAERCIKAGTSERGCCEVCGAPWARTTDKVDTGRTQKMADGWDTGDGGHGSVHRNGRESGIPGVPVMATVTTGWSPTCSCAAPVIPCTVLDPFAGAFTSLMVADRLQRHGIGIELNAEYCAMAERRIHKDAGLFADLDMTRATDAADASGRREIATAPRSASTTAAPAKE